MTTLQALQSVTCSRRGLFDFDGGGELVGAVSCGIVGDKRHGDCGESGQHDSFVAEVHLTCESPK